MSITVSTLGFPRIGPRRELKTALERFWAGKTNGQSLLADAAGLRAASWARQRSLGVTHIPSNDFSLYDHVLDTSVRSARSRRFMAGAGATCRLIPILPWRAAPTAPQTIMTAHLVERIIMTFPRSK